MTKSMTPAKELTKAGGKVLYHIPRCSGSSLFAADLEAVQSGFFANLPSPAFQSVLGLSALLDQEMLEPQQEETLKKSKKGSRKLNKMEGKALHFNEDDVVAVHSGELKNSSKEDTAQYLQGLEEMSFNVEQSDMNWLKTTYVCRVHNVGMIPTLQERLHFEGLSQCVVRYMGGNLILLSSLNADRLSS
ncbi:hypothetical protein Ancab_019211 [Ancistrocladus abbreviatus]